MRLYNLGNEANLEVLSFLVLELKHYKQKHYFAFIVHLHFILKVL